MNAPVAFCRRHALDAMAAGLIVQSLRAASLNLDCKLADRAAPSRKSIRQAAVSREQIRTKKPRVFAAFGGTNFKSAFHVDFP
jgi:hypothetical protein